MLLSGEQGAPHNALHVNAVHVPSNPGALP